MLCLSAVLVVSTAVDQICLKMSPCGADCFSTCDNPCKCDLSAGGGVPFPLYGGICQDAGFCESEFLDLQNCIEGGGPSCPGKMVDIDEVLENFTSYDFRIDVRSEGEWEEGHAEMSALAPGLAISPAKNYLHILGGKEDAEILVYCRSGGRAFRASQNLLRYGFSRVHSFYNGGFQTLAARYMME